MGTPKLAAIRTRFLLTAATLFSLWILLSGKWNLFHLGTGVISSLVIAAALFPWTGSHSFPIVRFLAFVPWQLWQVWKSNIHVAKLILSPKQQISPRLVRMAPGHQDERALTLLGCAITLTPGTVTVDISPQEMLVHALDEQSAKDVESNVMSQRVKSVFPGESK